MISKKYRQQLASARSVLEKLAALERYCMFVEGVISAGKPDLLGCEKPEQRCECKLEDAAQKHSILIMKINGTEHKFRGETQEKAIGRGVSFVEDRYEVPARQMREAEQKQCGKLYQDLLNAPLSSEAQQRLEAARKRFGLGTKQ